MIILTKRQKEILSILLRISNGTTIKQLEESVNVSRRTIYREFNELKLDLERRGLTISNIDGKYVLQGQERDIEQLREDIGDSPSQQEMSVSERQSILAAMLLLEDEPQKIVSLAMSLKVSEGTVQRDLTEVALALGKYGITLIKKKGVGISVKGTEFQRRQVLCGILLSEINDYRFFKYIGDDQDVGGNNYFLRLLPKKRIQLVTQALNKSVLKKINIKSDHQSMQLILLTTICLERAASSDNLGEIKAIDGSLKYQSLVYQFMAEYSQIEPLKLDRKEIIYLANQFQSCDNESSPTFYDNDQELALSLQIKSFVQTVSEKMKWDFQRNPAFLKRLTTHIAGLVSHQVERLPNTRIETLTRLSERYQDLFNAIKQAWKVSFPDEKLAQSELQLLLLYFANEYTSRHYRGDLKALVICENGIGTSSILGQRLKQEIPEVKKVKISKIAQLQDLDLSSYDLILSTLKLPGFPRKYQIVSPLLLDDEISNIKDYLKKYQENYIGKETENNNVYLNNSKLQPTKKLNGIAIGALFCTELVNGIEVITLKNKSTENLSQVIKEITNRIGQGIVKDKRQVAENLKRRIDLAPIGIPNSNMALLHTSSPEVKRCYFTVIDLDQSLKMKAMDQTEIEVSRMLLMLGPERLSDIEQDVMGMVSSMIVMSDDTLKLFATGTKEELQNAIAVRFLQEIKSAIPIR